jgi:hypothetical protein
MVVHGTPGAMTTGRVTTLNPHNDYMITLNTGDPIPSGAIKIQELEKWTVVEQLSQSLVKGNGKIAQPFSVRQEGLKLDSLMQFTL